MGRPWNTKRCRCKRCGDISESILEGKGHVSIVHGILWNKAREYLEELEEPTEVQT